MPKRVQLRCAALLLVLLATGGLLQAQAASCIRFMQQEPELSRSNSYQSNLPGVINRLLRQQDYKSLSSILLQPAEPIDFRMLPGGSPALDGFEP